MICPKCKAPTSVKRTDPVPEGKRRVRQCLSPRCGFRFYTTERVLDAYSPSNPDVTERMIAALQDGRHYDREAIAAALRTDARRAEISRRMMQDTDETYEGAAPDRLTYEEMQRELGR